MKLPKLIAIIGPTASGKTALSLKLAKKFKGEIVSADSRQIYRGMDIGTAKPSRNQSSNHLPRRQAGKNQNFYSDGVRHHLIDIQEPHRPYTLAQYKNDAVKGINAILKRGKVPFLVGGTGQYIAAIVQNWQIPRVKPQKNLRAKLERRARTAAGLKKLYEKLIQLDPEVTYIVDPKNPRRVIRALEVVLATGKPFTAARRAGKRLYDCLILGIEVPKAQLQKKILKRTRKMLKSGLVREVKMLTKTYGWRTASFDAIGYREIIAFLQKKISLPEAEKLINQNSIRFARRQMTWFRKMPVSWIKNQKQAERAIQNFLK